MLERTSSNCGISFSAADGSICTRGAAFPGLTASDHESWMQNLETLRVLSPQRSVLPVAEVSLLPEHHPRALGVELVQGRSVVRVSSTSSSHLLVELVAQSN